jgi:hypothetical protein|nr:MAG TPA: ASCH domain protein [Caudoviricetes sp.]
MFNDKYSLTQAVLDGRKTQTRRVIKYPREFKGEWVAGFNIHIRQSDKKVVGWPCMYDADEREFDEGEILPRYKVGEIVAVAQSYADIGIEPFAFCEAAWRNKMFVKAELMPYQIKITNVRIQRLQDISDEDCLREGIELNTRQYEYDGTKKYCVCGLGHWRAIGCTDFDTPHEAFAALIDKVSGKGTWESNPYVFVYEFELVD